MFFTLDENKEKRTKIDFGIKNIVIIIIKYEC